MSGGGHGGHGGDSHGSSGSKKSIKDVGTKLWGFAGFVAMIMIWILGARSCSAPPHTAGQQGGDPGHHAGGPPVQASGPSNAAPVSNTNVDASVFRFSGPDSKSGLGLGIPQLRADTAASSSAAEDQEFHCGETAPSGEVSYTAPSQNTDWKDVPVIHEYCGYAFQVLTPGYPASSIDGMCVDEYKGGDPIPLTQGMMCRSLRFRSTTSDPVTVTYTFIKWNR